MSRGPGRERHAQEHMDHLARDSNRDEAAVESGHPRRKALPLTQSPSCRSAPDTSYFVRLQARLSPRPDLKKLQLAWHRECGVMTGGDMALRRGRRSPARSVYFVFFQTALPDNSLSLPACECTDFRMLHLAANPRPLPQAQPHNRQEQRQSELMMRLGKQRATWTSFCSLLLARTKT